MFEITCVPPTHLMTHQQVPVRQTDGRRVRFPPDVPLPYHRVLIFEVLLCLLGVLFHFIHKLPQLLSNLKMIFAVFQKRAHKGRSGQELVPFLSGFVHDCPRTYYWYLVRTARSFRFFFFFSAFKKKRFNTIMINSYSAKR